MSSRDNILKKLRAAQQPFADVEPIAKRRVVHPIDDAPDVLLAQFVSQAEALKAHVIQPEDAETALDYILNVLGDDKHVLAWDFEHIPLHGLDAALQQRDITVADARAGDVRVGITGVDCALAATGSIVVSAQPGKPRTVSLLPLVHIAVLKKSQIMSHLEAWVASHNGDFDAFRQRGNTTIITGASRTADIAMELVLGAHGPAELHLMIMP